MNARYYQDAIDAAMGGGVVDRLATLYIGLDETPPDDRAEIDRLQQRIAEIEACASSAERDTARAQAALYWADVEACEDDSCPICGCMCDGTCEGADEYRRRERHAAAWEG